MPLNIQKCAHVTFSRKRIFQSCTFTLNNVTLKKAEEYKYLGIFITYHLRWNRHIWHIKNKVIGALGLLCRNFSQLKQQLYFPYLCSILDYGCVC